MFKMQTGHIPCGNLNLLMYLLRWVLRYWEFNMPLMCLKMQNLWTISRNLHKLSEWPSFPSKRFI